jgi:hypothetical protein
MVDWDTKDSWNEFGENKATHFGGDKMDKRMGGKMS